MIKYKTNAELAYEYVAKDMLTVSRLLMRERMLLSGMLDNELPIRFAFSDMVRMLDSVQTS